ncbi:hypothetical protein ONE63_007727 [Megalurothrips usitatus]|uniref:Uncharacterized protein n=1 Tax=Megalurothrips usitatus TaxID=439358 RepID=A0AAV7XR22_9NEOP|nr:hypothetical protein ONE63_007727 [Megalurothrips usitatus]
MAFADVRWGRRCLAAVLLLALASAEAQQPGGDYRLPGDIEPLHYDLKLVPYLEVGNMRYTGTVDITFNVVKDTQTIILHAHKDLAGTIKIEGIVDASDQSPLAHLTPSTDADKQFYSVPIKGTLKAGNTYILSLSFSNKLQKDNYGFYVSSYDVPGGFEYMATTHLEATSARKAFPCFDEPTYRATFTVSLAKLDDQIALSNMPPASEPSDYDPSIGNRRWVVFQQTPKMPTYLLAFIVCKLKKVETSNPNINIYVRGDAVDGVKKPAEVAPKLLSSLENFLGVSYPLPKLDLVAIPDFPAGAMENWGLITFKEDQLLVTDGVSGADRVAKSLRVIAHEFAHLWFGDLVTLKWWNTIWQQEGMAAFFESYILDKATDSEYGQMSQFGTNRAHSALEADALEHSPPLTKDDIQTPEQIEDHFGTITYSKGSNVHYMLMNVLGEDLYRQGLNSYLTSNEYTSTTIDDFAKALEDVAAQDGTNFPLKGKVTIKDLVSSWGNQAGYPVLTILRNWNDNTAKVSQARYLAHEPKSTAALDSKWTIPYSINSLFGKENTFTSVLTPSEAEQEVKLPYQLEPGRAFLWLNNHQSGFYRVNYDVRNWLLMGYGSNRMDAATRAATIDDLFALNRAGHVDTWIPLYYLQNSLGDTSASGERDVAPWTAGAKAIRGYSALVRGDPELSTYFQTFVAQIVAPAFEDIGFDGSDDSRYSTSVVRDIVTQLACENGLPECRRQALKAYNTISMSGDQEVYDPNVLAATTCTGALSFGAADLTKVIARVLNTEDVTARTSLLRGAGCVRSPALVQTLLGVATGADSGLSSGEAVYLLKSIMDHSPDGCDTALTYVHDNKASVDGSLLPSILQEIAKRIYKKEQLEKITELTKGDTSDATADMLAVAEATLKWAQGNLRELKEWVAAQLGVSPPRAPLLVDSASVPAPVPPTAQPRPTEPPGPAQEWLLPNHLQPERYSLDFTINMDPGTAPDKFSFSGVATIHINVVEATDKIVLHKHESLTVAVDSVESKDGDVALDGEPTYDVKHDFYTIALKEELKKGEKYTVKLTFSGPLKKDLAGLYLSSYTEGTDTKYLAVTQFEQTSARKAFPCFDEPKYRATFSISVIKHKSLGALSNTAGQTGGDVDKDHDIVIFEATPSMPTYLVALVVSELVEVKVTAATVGMPSISIWVRKEAKDEVGLAQELAPKVLKKLQALTGIPYVLPKLDLAAIPDFAPGAMENWGLITFKDTVLRTPKGALAHRRFNCARDITHEFSHLWFGDLVTNNWWSSLWQQEGMAAFMEAWVLDQATDYEYDAVARQSSDRIEQGLMDDALETAGPITNHTVGSPDEIEEHSGEITYNKGAGFLRMIRAILGEHTMWKGLRQYLVQHAYSTAGPEDLAAALQDAANEDGVSLPVTIQELMDSWTLKKGYPVLDVVRYLHDDRLTLRQSRFLSYTPVNETAAEEQWILPYNCEQLYRKGAKPFTSFLLSPEESSTLELQTRQYGRTSLSYIICNSEQEGFYRVNYDITSYRYLAKALSYGWIESDLQRGVLYDDALTLLRARRTEPYVVLYLLQNGVPGDVSLPVWAALSKGINYLRAALASDSAAIEDLNQYVRELTADSFGWVDWYNAFGWEESVQRNEVRQILTRLACDAREEVCVANAVNDYHKIAVDSKNYVIHQENYGALLCYNWQGADDVQKLQDELQKNSDYDQRVSIAYALGCVSSSKGRQHPQVKSLATADPSIYTTVAERSAAHGLAFAQDELGQVKDFLAANAGRTPPSPEPQQPTEYRLPGTVVPINYALTLKPVMDLAANDFSYTGEVKITVRVVESTDSIVLHSHEGLDVTLTGVTDDKNGEVATAGQPTFNSLSEMYTIKLAQNLEAEQQLVISLAFSGKLRKDKLGFYLSDYAEGVKWKYIATTQFEQTYARKAFPCFDEPKYRATFDISISREEDQIALSNMPLQSTSAPDANLGGRVLDTFQTTKPMPTYLVAFIVSELKKVPTSDPRISLYVRPDAVADAAFAAEITPRILAELEDFTGVPYALPKLDLVGIPDFYFGAMENWGLCTFRENRMLYAKGSATTEYKIFVAEVIAHELAHLWFGDYVTLDWWSSGWLKEGMAEFLEYLILDKIMVDGYDGWQPLSRLGVDDVNDGMAVDSLEHVRPLTDNAVATQDQIAEHMGDYTYTHGAGLQFLLMGVLGENNFRAGLKNYLTENAYGTGTPEKYAKALQEVADADKVLPSGITVLDIINSWSTKGGLPVVTVLRDYAANQVHVSQSRYLSLDPSQESTRDTKWLVPLAIYFNMNGEPSRFTAYLPENASSVTLELGGSGLGGGTVYGNWLQQGYYYTNYDFLNWIRIGSTIRNIDDPAWRALAIRDAFAVARAGLVDPWMPLYLLDMSIPQESNAAPWQATYDGLRAYAALAKADPEADQLFQMYLKTFIMEIGYNYVGWDNARGNKDGRVARDYATKLACSARVSDCRTKALQTYYGYLKDKNSPDPDTLAASLCEGLSHGDTVEYTALVEQLQATTERSRRMSIVYALGCVQNATIAKELLSLAGTMQGFEPQEVRRVFRSVMDNSPTGVDAAVDYVFNNFDFMAARYRSRTRGENYFF